MEHNFRQSVLWCLDDEGDLTLTDDPHDPGGPTKFGITIFDIAIRAGITNLKLSERDQTERWAQLKEVVRNLTRDEAIEIYKTKYWDKVRGDQLPPGVDYATFDFGVNSGVSRGIKALQLAVGVAPDGKIGPVTLAAVAKADPQAVVDRICTNRENFLRGLSLFWKYGKGWINRVGRVRKRARTLK